MSFHLDVLNREFKRRVSKNGRYSMRAYASFLGLHPSALSRVLAGKWDLTSDCGVDIAKKLQLEIGERRRFVRSIVEVRSMKEVARVGKLLEAPDLRPISKKISKDLYSRLARLNTLAFLELTFVKDFKSDIAWIAKALGIAVGETKSMIDDLMQIGILKTIDGRFVNTQEQMSAVDEKETTETNRRLQSEILERARQAIDEVPFEKRMNYGITMAIDPAKLESVRERISAFLDCLSDELECGDRTQVYQVGVSVFPLSNEMGPQ